MSSVIRVLWLGLEYPPLPGGDAQMSKMLCSEFEHFSEIELHVITAALGERLEVSSQASNVTIHRVPLGYPSDRVRNLNTLESLVYLVRARNYARELRSNKRFDLCHAIGTIPCGFLAYRWRQSMPYLVSIRGWDVPGFSEQFLGFHSLVKGTIQEIWKNAHTVAATSSDLQDLAHRTERGCAIRIIPDGVDLSRFSVTPRNSDGYFRIVFSGGFFERKGIGFLIDAVSSLAPRFPNLQLVLAGDGNRRQELEQQVRERNLESVVEFLGQVPEVDMPNVYANADVFVLPSLMESLSSSLLEAMASGLPIITTSTGGSRDWISGNGVIVAMHDAESIARAIESYLVNPQLWQEHSNNSRKIAKRFTWESSASQYRSLYHEIVKSPRSTIEQGKYGGVVRLSLEP